MGKRKYDIKPRHWTVNTNDGFREVGFFKDVMGMKLWQHQETTRGTAAKISRSVVGYLPPSEGFTIEVLHLQGIPKHKTSYGLLGFTIVSKMAIARAKALNWPIQEMEEKLFKSSSPSGYVFYLVNEPTPTDCDPIKEICLVSSFLISTVNYWTSTFGATVSTERNDQATLSFGDDYCKIRFVESLTGQVHGHLTLTIPADQLKLLEHRSLEEHQPIKIRHTADVVDPISPCHSLTLTDPDGYELVFFEQEPYSALSITDANAENAFDPSSRRFDCQSRNSVQN